MREDKYRGQQLYGYYNYESIYRECISGVETESGVTGSFDSAIL